jgi:tetratricopeptide (TPR) repeat protein
MALRLGVASGVLVLVAAGVGLGWSAFRRGTDLLARSRSAYARGDWSQAAELARLRLKAVPEDTDALRMLARSAARLGEDARANRLFARIGSDALAAEDLFLLGLGLDRSGQKDAARGAWQKALRLEDNHAETLEQLIIQDTAQNRLAEAAELAERLARQPGWELRGELNLGVLRAELSEPARAVTVLERALKRPEAELLDNALGARYHKLLARGLQQTGRSAEARVILRRILDQGSDREASWLMSRAALEVGALADAADALVAAGSYRAQHPLEAEPGVYAGAARCAPCHQATFRAIEANRHSSTLTRGKELAGLPYPDRPIADPDDPAVRHTFQREGDRIRFKTTANDRVSSAIVAYAFGSPDRYVSLVGPDEHGRNHILRLSHFQAGRDSGWVRTTGHSADAGGGRDILGKPLDEVDGIQKCLFCHSTNPRAVLEQSGPEAQDRAIGCERCHGPGEPHLKAVAAKFSDLAIINPTNADGPGRVRLCGQCHAYHQELALPRTDPFWIRFQGTTLTWSRCYTSSGGLLDCITCHDPHQIAAGDAAFYASRCLACHSGAKSSTKPPAPIATDRALGEGPPCPVNPATGCVGCHMPPYRSEPLRATYADHYIRVHREIKPQSRK